MLEVGFSKVTITPPLGTPLGGYEEREKGAIGIHDDVFARCMLFHETEQDIYFALIICDLLWVNYGFSEGIKDQIEIITRKKIPRENVIIHAIHVHSSQEIVGGLDFYYKRFKKQHNIDKSWYVKQGIPYTQRMIASSVYGALQHLNPSFISANIGTTDVGHNRRYGDEAAKIVDTEIIAVNFSYSSKEAHGENVQAIFYNLANHCVALGEDNYYISADWPFFAAKILREVFQLPWNSMVIYGQGTAGNTNPYNCRFGDEKRTIRDAETLGAQTAADLIKVLRPESMKLLISPQDPCIMELISESIRVEVVDEDKLNMFRSFQLWWLGLEEVDDKVFLVVKLSLLRINSLIFFCVPGEPFGEFGVEMKKIIRSHNPDFIPIILELSEGAVSYITTRDSYNNGKGYEASISGSAETGYKILEVLPSMLKKLSKPPISPS